MRKNSNLVAQFLLLSCIIFVSCASQKMTGWVSVAGTEPYTWIEIAPLMGHVVRVSASDTLQKKLQGLKGKRVRVGFSKLYSDNEGVTVVVHSVEEVKEWEY